MLSIMTDIKELDFYAISRWQSVNPKKMRVPVIFVKLLRIVKINAMQYINCLKL